MLCMLKNLVHLTLVCKSGRFMTYDLSFMFIQHCYCGFFDLHRGIVPPLKNVFRTTSSVFTRWQQDILFNTGVRPILEYH